MKTFHFPLTYTHGLMPTRISIPQEIEVPVALIYHELINRMIFEHLRRIGMECDLEHFQDNLILASLNMADGTDKTFEIYSEIIEPWSKNVVTNKDVIVRRALKIYHELVKARTQRAKKPELIAKKTK